MHDPHQAFAIQLASSLHQLNPELRVDNEQPDHILINKHNDHYASLDLTPFRAEPQTVSARGLFENIHSLQQLIERYYQARSLLPFEESLAIFQSIDDEARKLPQNILNEAREHISDKQAECIANWIKHLDIYTAVKSVESLLNSRADIKLLMVAEDMNWHCHFDHLAIRCGSSTHKCAEQVRDLLIQYHGYVPAQMKGADYYHFNDGWNAYLLYKILNNGQVLRLFIDQSDSNRPEQVIQHWNQIYGFTAHHLAMRLTTADNSSAIRLNEVADRLKKDNVNILTPTGLYTQGILEQAFTQPERNRPLDRKTISRLKSIRPGLEDTLKNGKLLELVSRTELPAQYKPAYFDLYKIKYDSSCPQHSVPVYEYFLPEQAAHVIRTSVEAI